MLQTKKKAYCVICSCSSGSPYVRATLTGQLEKIGNCCSLFNNAWLVRTAASADDVYNKLIPVLGGDDEVVILELGEQSCSWLLENPKADRWLRRHV